MTAVSVRTSMPFTSLDYPVYRRSHVRVERGHRLRGPVDDGDADPAPHKRLGHLHADVAPADHHGLPRLRAVQIRQERGAIIESLHPEHAGGIHAGQRRRYRDRAGRDDQRVEAFPGRLPCGEVMSEHPAAGQVNLLDLGAHPQVDAVAPVCVRRPGDQTLRPVDIPGDPVRDPAGPEKELYAPRSNATISTASPAIRLACEAALIPAASAPMTMIRSVMRSRHPTPSRAKDPRVTEPETRHREQAWRHPRATDRSSIRSTVHGFLPCFLSRSGTHQIFGRLSSSSRSASISRVAKRAASNSPSNSRASASPIETGEASWVSLDRVADNASISGSSASSGPGVNSVYASSRAAAAARPMLMPLRISVVRSTSEKNKACQPTTETAMTPTSI